MIDVRKIDYKSRTLGEIVDPKWERIYNEMTKTTNDKPRTAVYSGTFDPITNGHEDIIKRASKLFDTLYVAVSGATKKTTMFTYDERVSLAEQVVKKYPNVVVKPMDGLLVEFVKENECDAIVRGIRNGKDFDYEVDMAGMNKYLIPEVDTIFLLTSDDVRYISSSFVRELSKLGGDITGYVHSSVLEALKPSMEELLKKSVEKNWDRLGFPLNSWESNKEILGEELWEYIQTRQ